MTRLTEKEKELIEVIRNFRKAEWKKRPSSNG